MLKELPVGVIRRRDVIDNHVRIVLSNKGFEVHFAVADLMRERRHGDNPGSIEGASQEIDDIVAGIDHRCNTGFGTHSSLC